MFERTQRRRLARALASAAAILAVIATGLGTGNAQAAEPPVPGDKIRPDLKAQLETKSDSDFWVRFTAKADLAKAGAVKDWVQRGTAVAEALKQTAETSQEAVRKQLDDQGVGYQSFWATNAIKVTNGSLDLAESLAVRGDVEGLYAPVAYDPPEIVTGEAEPRLQALEWGIANIKADQVWAQYGVKGAGVVVANIDTGVQFNHPALVNSYRGNNGDGTFNHNYNWFRAAGSCAAPCDNNNHGTHTMGTMAGLDGANQIGVAPDVKWIAANGCCPNDAALIASGQWMLQPTDLNNQNPDASKRPNIVNNSWGTVAPSNDPFMEDISIAWEASGIFGMWANGNSGALGCRSSGSPGSRIINYSAGNYDINNTINDSSGKGAGQDNEIKPNISAPGTNVRSAITNNGYANFTGTSMASPHVAGAIALLWSASPVLYGDVAATKALLDDTASDQADARCGGTTDDNSIYGEGRLDALALMDAAPIGDVGTLAGTVTDAGTGNPIGNATVNVTGPINRQVTTAANGTYSTRLPAGSYTVTVSAYGYLPKSASATVVVDQTTTTDLALTAAPTVNVSGTIADGSGHGWPLYAKVSVEGPGGIFDYTTPVTGRYGFRLPAGATYTLKVEPQYPGYQTVSKQIQVGTRNVTANVDVPVRFEACETAPGYAYGSDGAYQAFSGTSTPAGWTVVDNVGNGQVWRFDDHGGRGNLTGGAGSFAVIDSDEYGLGGRQDTSLVSPVVDLTAVTAPVIQFNQDYNNNGEKADVDLSLDGGATWTTVLSQTTDLRGPRQTTIPIPQAAGKSQVQVRFHYHVGTFDWWWEVDSVLIGSDVRCDPVDGGLVVGHVRDANTNGFVNGATVTSMDKPSESARTAATPADTGLADGFFWLFSSLTGTHPFAAKAGNYVAQVADVEVETDWAVQAGYSLAAGRLSITPGAVDATLRMPTGTATRSFTITNTGTAPAEVEFSERGGTFELLQADGSRLTEQQVLHGTGAPEQRLEVPMSFGDVATGSERTAAAEDGPSADPWTNIGDYPENIMDNRVVNLNGKVYSIAGNTGAASTGRSYVYDPIAKTWTAIAPVPANRSAMTVGVVGGKIIASGGWGATGPDKATWSYDPATNAWTALADNPTPRSAAGQAVVDGKLYAVGGCTTSACTPMSNSVLRYDPATNAWQTLANYPISAAFAACGGIDGIVYCTGGTNGTAGQTASFAYDPESDVWSPIADAPRDSWAASTAVANGKLLVVGGAHGPAITNAGFAYDPTTESWGALPNANTPRYRGGASCGFYKIGGSSGNFNSTRSNEVLPGLGQCAEGPTDVSWLGLDTASVTLAPGAQATVRVTLTANVDQPGKYTAGVTVKENTPYSVPPVGVTMNATPPTTWGKLLGTVSGTTCSNAVVPIEGAVVQVDSWANSWTFATDIDGKYAYWMDRRNNPLTMIVAKDGWKPQTRQARVDPAVPSVQDFNLKPIRC